MPTEQQQPTEGSSTRGSPSQDRTPSEVTDSQQVIFAIIREMLSNQDALLRQNRVRPLAPSSPKNPLFDRYNATAYVERFKSLLAEYDLKGDTDTKKIQRFLRTILLEYQQTVKSLLGVPNKGKEGKADYQALRKVFLKEYRNYDKRQIRASRTQLENLYSVKRKAGNDLRGYVREFVLSVTNIDLEEVPNFERIRLLLKGLLIKIATRIYRRYRLKLKDYNTMQDFRTVLAAIRLDIESETDARKLILSEEDRDIKAITQ